MGADWWKPRKTVFIITLYKHENFRACRVGFTGILNKNKLVQNSGFRIKNMNKRSVYSRHS